MALYVVLHHQRDQNQSWVNAWVNDELIDTIQTTHDIGALCRRAKDDGEKVFVHRCRWQEEPPVICCSADVEAVDEIDRSPMLVRFANPVLLNGDPPPSPVKGQNHYII